MSFKCAGAPFRRFNELAYIFTLVAKHCDDSLEHWLPRLHVDSFPFSLNKLISDENPIHKRILYTYIVSYLCAYVGWLCICCFFGAIPSSDREPSGYFCILGLFGNCNNLWLTNLVVCTVYTVNDERIRTIFAGFRR